MDNLTSTSGELLSDCYNSSIHRQYNDGEYLTPYTIFVLTLACLIIIANVLLILIILKSPALRKQVNRKINNEKEFYCDKTFLPEV